MNKSVFPNGKKKVIEITVKDFLELFSGLDPDSKIEIRAWNTYTGFGMRISDITVTDTLDKEFSAKVEINLRETGRYLK
jgi:hypothetical protein